MELLKITDKVYCFSFDQDKDYPNLGYVQGKSFSIAIDAGASAAHLALFYEALKNQGLRLPALTILTHWHWDHTFAMHAVNGLTVAAKATNEKLKLVKHWKWDKDSMKKRVQVGREIPFCDEKIKQEYKNLCEIKVSEANLVFAGDFSIDMGGTLCEAIEVIAPHSKDSTIVYIPEQGIIFAGDAHNEDLYAPSIHMDQDKRREYHDFLQKLDFSYYFSGHSEVKKKEEILRILK